MKLLNEELELRVEERTNQLQEEIQRRQEIQEQLQVSKTRWRNLFEQVAVGMAQTDLQGRFVWCNQKYCEIVGYSSEELKDKTFIEVIHPDERETECEQNQLLLREELSFVYRKRRYIRKNGDLIWVNITCSLIKNAQGSPDRIISVIEDISNRQKAEAALRESESRFRLMANSSPVLIWMSGKDGLCNFLNQRWLDFLGKTTEEILRDGWSKYVHPDDRDDFLAVYNASFSIRSNFTMEYRLRRYDGEYRWVLDQGVPRFTEDGEFVGYVGSCVDITSCKQAEKELIRNQKFTQRIIESTSNIIFIYSLVEERILYVNEEVNRILGYTTQQIYNLGSNIIASLIHPDDVEKIYQHFQQLEKIKEGECLAVQYRTIDAQRNWRWFISRSTIFSRNREGSPEQLIVTATDITQLKEFEQALQQTNSQLISTVAELQQRNQDLALLHTMTDFLQACQTLEEAYRALGESLFTLFSNTSGGVFILNSGNNLMELVTTWGHDMSSETLFATKQCWALRRGRAHEVADSQPGLLCSHIHPDNDLAQSFCVPLSARGETIGLLYFETKQSQTLTPTKRQLIYTVAEQISLALSNLTLQEKLQEQTIRDPLTGLFNRRYLEETLERELYYAHRKQISVGVMMIDVDHFKRFNDNFGHEAGDLVLQAVAQYLQTQIRQSDIVCRYGGEELTLILPDASLRDTALRAEEIRQGIKTMEIEYQNRNLGNITISIGVACFPQHGLTKEAIIRCADIALYRAKQQGRDRTVIAMD